MCKSSGTVGGAVQRVAVRGAWYSGSLTASPQRVWGSSLASPSIRTRCAMQHLAELVRVPVRPGAGREPSPWPLLLRDLLQLGGSRHAGGPAGVERHVRHRGREFAGTQAVINGPAQVRAELLGAAKPGLTRAGKKGAPRLGRG